MINIMFIVSGTITLSALLLWAVFKDDKLMCTICKIALKIAYPVFAASVVFMSNQ